MTNNFKLDPPKITQITAESHPEIWALLQPPPLEDEVKGASADEVDNPSADANPKTRNESLGA